MMPDPRDIRLRALDTPRPIRVRVDRNGRPMDVASPKRRAGERVAAVQEIWRIDDEWWRHPISRLYHRVVLENGRVATIYRDLTDGKWFAQ